MGGNELAKVEFDGESFSVDAALVARGFGVTPVLLRSLMRRGKIVSRCERGMGEDAGKHRLTFLYGVRRLRLLVDDAGNVITQEFDHGS
ncbi:MAG: hypothetical protein CMLOHMNK_02824 [Steroidobacteraceae bacterium]|nr:hypothetical protein [Steroidobacteraceae bacterium]